jgi:hypothetical protein
VCVSVCVCVCCDNSIYKTRQIFWVFGADKKLLKERNKVPVFIRLPLLLLTIIINIFSMCPVCFPRNTTLVTNVSFPPSFCPVCLFQFLVPAKEFDDIVSLALVYLRRTLLINMCRSYQMFLRRRLTQKKNSLEEDFVPDIQ